MEKGGSGQSAPHSEEYLRAHTIGELKPLSALVIVADYDPEWPRQFRDEDEKIRSAMGERACGSNTSVSLQSPVCRPNRSLTLSW